MTTRRASHSAVSRLSPILPYIHTAVTSLGLSLKLLVFIESKERPKVDQKTVFLDGSQPSEAWRRLGIVLSQRAVWGTQCVYN